MPKPYTADLGFYDVLTLAVADLAEHGFDSAERVVMWQERLKKAALRSLVPEYVLQRHLTEAFRSTYRRQVERGSILSRHPGVSRFTLDRASPRLRAELDRRIVAAADLIKLNREQAVAETLRRLSGWATSIPAGGSETVDRAAEKTKVRKAMASLPFEERRVIIDQSHKLLGNLNQILATDGGAIAATWHSHGASERNYDARPIHLARDGKVFLIRDSWAHAAGFVRPGPEGYTDDIEMVGQLIFCRCFYSYVYNLRSLPPGMLTEKGRAELQRVRIAA